MKGFTKAIKRTPHMMTSKVGLSKKSTDPEFDDYQRKFTIMEETVEKILKDCKKFNEAVVSLFTSGTGWSTHFSALFHPMTGEYDVIGKWPNAAHTVRNVDAYQTAMEELRATISPELELIESRIVGPTKELQAIMKHIRKSITKRDHKLLDYDRHNNSLTKLREKKEKSLNDEKNLFKLEQDFEAASNDYDNINNACKTELPQFMIMATQFINPLFHSFYYMQLNIFYLMLEKLNGFAESKYDVSVHGEDLIADYEAKRGDAREQVEALNVTKKFLSTSKMLTTARSVSGSSQTSSLGRIPSSASSTTRSFNPPPPSPSASGFVKKAPPPPPTFGSKPGASLNSSNSVRSAVSRFNSAAAEDTTSPPPYSPVAGAGSRFGSVASAASAAAVAKKAPPPPPPLKPKPKMEPPKQYVVALFDFAPQADGDLGFSAGDRIEVVERTTSAEDWWTGKLNGQQGIFPGNYVQDA